jgi:hypothetical protein
MVENSKTLDRDFQGHFGPPDENTSDFALFADRVLANPLFPAGRAAFVDEILSLYEGNPFLCRMLTEAGRGVVFFNLLTLHANYDPQDRETWPTMKLLKRTVAGFGVTSERRVHDILRRIIATGYAKSTPSPVDKRARLLSPTPKMLEHHRDWLRAFHTPLHLMYPDPGYLLAVDRDEAFQLAQLKAGWRWLNFGAELMARNPVIMFFMARDAGVMILMKLIQLDRRGTRSKSVRLFADFAEKFGVSRTHVSNLIGEAVELGYLGSSDFGFVVLPVAASAFDRFLADSMVGNNYIYRAATSAE